MTSSPWNHGIVYKVRKHMRTHGPLYTVKMAVRKLRDSARALDPKVRRLRIKELEFERAHGIDTYHVIPMDEVSASGDTAHAESYQPTPVWGLPPLLRGLSLPFEEYTFIDLGSGMGRALLMASEFPFRRIIGVEFSPELHRHAEANLRNYRSSTRRCNQIELVCMDATRYVLPPEPTVLYMFNPFHGPVMEAAVRNIGDSLREHPRDILIAYLNPTEQAILDRAPLLELRTRTKTTAIYHSRR